MKRKILLVDDEAAVLSGYERSLYRDFDVVTAPSGECALRLLETQGPFAVVISDMRMPEMNGAQFLEKAHALVPDTVRMLLTGHAEADTAVQAVNQGAIFRFLTKPISKEVLIATIETGVAEYDLICTKRDLLEKTLMSSIKVLTEILGATSPEAFGRSTRIGTIVRHLASRLDRKNCWQWEAAATLSQLGCVTLEPDLLRKSFAGEALTPEELARFDTHPSQAMHLLQGIPRLEGVAWMVGHQMIPLTDEKPPMSDPKEAEEVTLGAQVLRLALAFDDLLTNSGNRHDSILKLRSKQFDPPLVDALQDFSPQKGPLTPHTVAAHRLAPGMILDQDLRSHNGTLLIPKGQEITTALRLKIENFANASVIDKEIRVLRSA